MYVTKDLNRMSSVFLRFVQNRLIKLSEKDPSLEKNIQIIDYTRINDSDKPGIIEVAIVKAGARERKFKATYWHNDHYRNFVELQGEGGAKK